MNMQKKFRFNHYLGRDRQWNRYDFLVFGKFPLISFRTECDGPRWILSICKLPIVFFNPL